MCALYEQYKHFANHCHDMIELTDIHGNVEYASPSYFEILGYSDETDIFMNLHPDDQHRIRDILNMVVQSGDSMMVECRKRAKDGKWVWVETSASPITTDKGGIRNILFITRDISDRKQYQHELERMAYHDHLTGLYNRRKMKIIMEELLEEAKIANEKFAILIMDLDKFKSINDTYGHDVGDLVLKEFASRLLQNKLDRDAVGRLSGDEFSVVLWNVDGKLDVDYYVQRIRHAFAQPCILAGLESGIPIKSSIGYAIYPDHGDSVKVLFKQADVSLYKEKRKRHQLRLRKAGDRRALQQP